MCMNGLKVEIARRLFQAQFELKEDLRWDGLLTQNHGLGLHLITY